MMASSARWSRPRRKRSRKLPKAASSISPSSTRTAAPSAMAKRARRQVSASTLDTTIPGSSHLGWESRVQCADVNRNISERLEGEVQTNQRAELTAILRALESINDAQPAEVRTDSKYSIQCVTEWYVNWLRNG